MRFDPRNGRMATFLLVVFLWGQYGCVFWHRHERRLTALPKLAENRNALYLVVLDGNHERIWKV